MGCASVFGATDAFAVGFVGKRFDVVTRSLSEIEPCPQRRAERRGAGGRAHSRRRHDPVVRRQAARLFPAAGGRSGKAVGGECRGPAHRRKVEPDRTRWPAGFVCAGAVGASVPRPKRAKRTVGFRGRMVCRGGVYARSFPPAGIGGLRTVRIVQGQRGFPVASARKFRPISLGRRAPEFV